MNFNTVAAAVLVVGISALVISKVGDILIPEQYFTHKTDAAESAGEGSEGREKPASDPSVAVALASADAARGEKQMQSKCKSCHTWNKGGKNGTGPNLWGVVGAKKGAHDGYNYSSGMKEVGGEWTYEKLYDFLKQPSSVVKGTKMSYRLRKYKQRADVIAFLRTQSDKPLPLPKAETPPAKKPDETKPGEKPAEKKDGEKKTDTGKKADGVDKAAMEAKKKAEEAKKQAEEAAKKAAADAKMKAEEAAKKAKEAAEAKAKAAAMKAKDDARKAAEEAAQKAKEKAEAAKKAAEEAAAKAKAEAEAKAKAAAMKAKEEAAKAAEKAKDAAKKTAEDAKKPEGKPDGGDADKKTE